MMDEQKYIYWRIVVKGQTKKLCIMPGHTLKDGKYLLRYAEKAEPITEEEFKR
jgi:hypothetical protein